ERDVDARPPQGEAPGPARRLLPAARLRARVSRLRPGHPALHARPDPALPRHAADPGLAGLLRPLRGQPEPPEALGLVRRPRQEGAAAEAGLADLQPLPVAGQGPGAPAGPGHVRLLGRRVYPLVPARRGLPRPGPGLLPGGAGGPPRPA